MYVFLSKRPAFAENDRYLKNTAKGPEKTVVIDHRSERKNLGSNLKRKTRTFRKGQSLEKIILPITTSQGSSHQIFRTKKYMKNKINQNPLNK